MKLSFELNKKVVDFLNSIPNIGEIPGRKALVTSAGLDDQLIDFTGPTGQFCQNLVSTLVKYGKLRDGRGESLEALLEATKNNIGLDRQEYCDMLIQELRESEDQEKLRLDYLNYLQETYRNFDMRGVLQIQQVTHQLPLKDIYVPLNAYPAHETFTTHRIAGRNWRGGVSSDEDTQVTSAERTFIEESVKRYPASVVLGDPGSGKSTFLKILALNAADKKDDVLPIIVPLNAYARRLQQKGEINLLDYLAEYYTTHQQRFKKIGSLFRKVLQDHKAFVLLDGLDEVQENRQFLVQLVEEFVSEYILPHDINDNDQDTKSLTAATCNRIVVTSRIVGYKNAPLSERTWRTYMLTDFNRSDIEKFVSKWTRTFAYMIKGETEVARQEAEIEHAELLAAISSRPGVERLAANPLLLTILTLIKYHGVAIPNERVRLYELYLETLIENWNRARALDKHKVGTELDYGDTVRILAPMALWLRETNPSAGLISRHELEKWLTTYFCQEEGDAPGEARRHARHFLKNVEKTSNLLVERGEKQYGFLHLTLEEMLAAQGIVYLMDGNYSASFSLFSQYLLEPKWHETLLLAIGFVGGIRRNRTLAGTLLQELLRLELPAQAKNRQVTFASEALLDMGKKKVHPAIVDEIINALMKAMEDSATSVLTRCEAGSLLGWLGDPRQGIDTLPPLLTEPIGSERKIKPFKAGIYPVTNAQFAAFITHKGYENQQYWSDDGWFWRQKQSKKQPDYWEDTNFNNPNHPVVGVTWYEAEAFCNWLSAFHGQGRFRLPTEKEWKCLAYTGSLHTFEKLGEIPLFQGIKKWTCLVECDRHPSS